MSASLRDDSAVDLLCGTPAIAAHIGKTERQTDHLLQNERLPAFKLGGQWHMRKSGYAAFIESLEKAALARCVAQSQKPETRVGRHAGLVTKAA